MVGVKLIGPVISRCLVRRVVGVLVIGTIVVRTWALLLGTHDYDSFVNEELGGWNGPIPMKGLIHFPVCNSNLQKLRKMISPEIFTGHKCIGLLLSALNPVSNVISTNEGVRFLTKQICSSIRDRGQFSR